ncbi:MAG: tetratricopeptide repeat protein, partial [Cyanobacteriota bacterium]|nr:tetratricopeptide repeat protein [Cyanobacteriota bacterium]
PEALAPTEEALKIYRELAQSNPAYRPDVAMALNNLGKSLSEVSRRPEALASTEEALKIYRELAQSNPAYRPDVAMALTNLGVMLSEVGRRPEALAPTEEALKIYRELAQSNPAYRPDVAKALNNLGNRLREVGRRPEALAPTEEAVKILRELAQSNPAYRPNLAKALNNLGYLQLQLAQPEIARSAYEESIAIIRPLAATNPAFQEDLQRTLNNLEELNRKEGIRTGAQQLLGADDISFLPKDDPNTEVKRSVVRLWPTFIGQQSGIGQLGTGFVVKRQGDRAWIATALHVLRDKGDSALATKVEAEIYTGPLPPNRLPPRLEVVLPPVESLKTDGEDLIILEIRGLPADVQSLPLSSAPPAGALQVVGHYPRSTPWNVIPMIYLDALTEPSARELKFAGDLDSGASGAPVLNGSREVVGLVRASTDIDNPNKKVISAYRAMLLREIMP